MGISNEHNLRAQPPETRPFGIRVRLKPGDPFVRLVEPEWQKIHWFASENERDAAFDDMSGRHVYSRRGDVPTIVYEKIGPSGPG